ncbi:MAG: Txe/YoeB family addiction module toxin [Anaerolineales bacterium]
MRNLEFDAEAFEDLGWWVRHDRKTALRIFKLIEAARRDPYRGLGKPEPLRHQFSGAWSRRINKEDRLVYSVREDRIFVLACRGHYE